MEMLFRAELFADLTSQKRGDKDIGLSDNVKKDSDDRKLDWDAYLALEKEE